MKIRCWMFLFLLVIASVSVQAIGLRSISLNRDIVFVPHFQDTYYYSIVPVSSTPIDILAYVADDDTDGTELNLSQYFHLSRTEFYKIDPNTEPSFSVTVKLPKVIPEPGTHKVRIGVVELPKDRAGFVVRTSIESLFFIRVSYEGQYLVYSLEAESVNKGTPAPMTVHVKNIGTKPIQKISSDIQIFNSRNESVANGKTNFVSLNSQEQKELTTEISTNNLYPGNYLAKATINYDGNTTTAEDDFKIGQLNFEIKNQTDTIFAGKINEIFIDVESEWAEQVNNVYAEVSINGMTAVKTTSKNFNGFEKSRLQGFYDASTLTPGVYDMTIILHYGDKTTVKNTKINIVKETMFGIPKLNMSTAQIVFILVLAVLILINISLFFILVKKKDEHEKQQ